LQNQPSAADTTDVPPNLQGGVDVAWAQVAADLKTVQQQALATQRAIDQLQSHQEAPSNNTLWPVSMALPAGGWGVAGALVLVAVVLLAWRSLRKPVATAVPTDGESIASDFSDDPVSMMELQQPVQEGEVSQWATQVETEEDLVSDWGSIPLVRQDPATTFDLEAATNEVTRVRKTLAERRAERALQLERDAQLRREAAKHAEEAALASKLQAEQHRGAWVPDLDLSQDFDVPAAVVPVAVPEPEPEPLNEPLAAPLLAPEPPLPPAPLENPPMNTYAQEPEAADTLSPNQQAVGSPPPAPIREPDTPALNIYAVKLALAHESEAIALWDEAHELAEEVLGSPDAVLRAQAQATLQRLAVKMQGEEESAHAVLTVSAPAPAPALGLEVPQIPPPEPEPQQDMYAVKLALAHESEAIELWDEARELAEEVLASPDPVLIAQAQALLAQIQQKLDDIAQDSIPFDPALDIPTKPVKR
jgi:hypothetical protein